MAIYFVAGEPSGDMHGAHLMQALAATDRSVCFLGRGGPKMQAIAASSSFHNWCDQAAVLGLWEVLKKYSWFRKQFHQTLEEIAHTQPAAVVLIDYPGFNLRLAKALRQKNYRGKIIYYISPQVWAWNRSRIPKMARWLDLMLCIFPFETTLYKASGLKTQFVGHPLLEHLASRLDPKIKRKPNLIGLFPGSRSREVRLIFPIFLKTIAHLQKLQPELEFTVAAATPYLASELKQIRSQLFPQWTDRDCKIEVGTAHRLMQESAAGLVSSGTATLEAAYFQMPSALVYKVNPLTYWAARAVIQVPYLGIVNLLAQKEVAKEYIQGNAQPLALAKEIQDLLHDPKKRADHVSALQKVVSDLQTSETSPASSVAAKAILDLL